jgi:VWFA-related protein
MKPILFALAIVCTATAAAAQQSQDRPGPDGGAPPSTATAPAQQQPTFRTGVDVITVDVAAVDGRGQPITDLHAPEFTVKIDGKPRRVFSADLVKYDYNPDPVVRRPEPKQQQFETLYTTNITEARGRMIMIAVDQMNIRPGAARPILESAARFLDKLNPADRVAFVSFPEPGIVVDFTSDRQRVRLAMQKVIGTQSRFVGRRNIGLVEAIDIAQKGDDRRMQEVTNRECRGLLDMALEQCMRDIVDESNSILWTTRRDTEASLRGLREWLQRLGETEGQKTLILLSEGLVTDSPTDLEDVVRAGMRGRVAINVLLMDVPRSDATQGPLPPTFTEDRELQIRGLNDLASLSRGSIFQIVGTADRAFDRLASEISAYYLLSVEQAPADNDGRNHRIDVSVQRRGVTLRSRQAFVLDPTGGRRTADESLVESLRSPLAVAGVPLRLSTFIYQDQQANGKVRVVLAADVGQAGTPSGQYTMGFIVVSDEGKVVASRSSKEKLEPLEGRTNASLSYLDSVSVDPGVYEVRLAAVDADGRHGSVVRDVNAWKMAGEEFTYADLVVNHAATATSGLRPDVEPHVDADGVAAYMELYAGSEETFKDVKVNFEIADDDSAPALLTMPVDLRPGSRPTWRNALGFIGAEPLPAGRYVARARITKGEKLAGVLVRPFILEPAPAAKGGPIVIPSAFARVAPFDRNAVLQPALLTSMLDVVGARSPSLKSAMTEARAGRYAPAALEALTAGDQQAAAFLKGLDLYARGQIDQAATQLNIAAGPRRDFYPAALLLGACFAAGGKDRDAAGIWQMALGTEERPQVAYTMLADARMRGGQADAVVSVLKPAYAIHPTDDELGKRLAIAYLVTAEFSQALPILDAYLTRHPADGDALFAAILAQYQVALVTGAELSAADKAKLLKYEKAYKGPQQALLAKYVTSLGVTR